VFQLVVLSAGVAAGAIAAISGFGIGSLLTPVFALQVDTKTAVAAVSLPHIIGTAFRLWLLRSRIHRRLLLSFGLTSAAGGLAGALLHAQASSPALAIVFGSLLIFAGGSELTGLAGRWRLHGGMAWAAGALSGFFGGLVGNQGGIRSAAMLGFDVARDQFVATATATALLVDIARVPVYLTVEREAIATIGPLLLLATVGVLAGTVLGRWLLRRVPQHLFRRVVGATVLLLGVVTLLRRST
jgi:uncharacterized membrane protein YfcA